MAHESDYKKRPKRDSVIRAAWITGILGVVAALAAVLLTRALAGSSEPNPPPSPKASSSAVAVNLTAPAPEATVSQTKPFQITGTVSHLGNDSLWLTDYDGRYFVDGEVTVSSNGAWQAVDSGVGDPHRALPFPVTLRVILADGQCAAKLNATMKSKTKYVTALPSGCSVATEVVVEVTSR
jgi:hypothetical protein